MRVASRQRFCERGEQIVGEGRKSASVGLHCCTESVTANVERKKTASTFARRLIRKIGALNSTTKCFKLDIVESDGTSLE